MPTPSKNTRNTSPTTPQTGSRLTGTDPQNRPLMKINFILMAVSGILIVVGFLLMLGGGTTSQGFNPDIFSTRRIVVGPAVALFGFIAMGVAIMWKKPGKNAEK